VILKKLLGIKKKGLISKLYILEKKVFYIFSRGGKDNEENIQRDGEKNRNFGLFCFLRGKLFSFLNKERLLNISNNLIFLGKKSDQDFFKLFI